MRVTTSLSVGRSLKNSHFKLISTPVLIATERIKITRQAKQRQLSLNNTTPVARRNRRSWHTQECKNPRRGRPSVAYVRSSGGNIAFCLNSDKDVRHLGIYDLLAHLRTVYFALHKSTHYSLLLLFLLLF